MMCNKSREEKSREEHWLTGSPRTSQTSEEFLVPILGRLGVNRQCHILVYFSIVLLKY